MGIVTLLVEFLSPACGHVQISAVEFLECFLPSQPPPGVGHPSIRPSEEGGEALGLKWWEQLPHLQADFLFREV